MFEADLQSIVNQLLDADRCWWDVVPEGVSYGDGPVVVLQQIGGKAHQYVENDTLPDHKHARVNLRVIGKSREVVAPLARLIADGIRVSGFVVEVYGEPVADYDETYKLATTDQEFGFWFNDVNDPDTTPLEEIDYVALFEDKLDDPP